MNLSFEEKVPINYYEIVKKNSIRSDVDIVIRNKVIKAHKQVLGTQNPIFLDKFLSQPDLTRIEILDLDPTAVDVFIHYLYTGKVSDDSLNDDLFRVAHRYVDPNLKNLCRGWLGKNLTTQNVVDRLLMFQALGEENWTKETVNFLIQNFNDVKMQPGFMDVLKQRAIFDIFESCKVTILFEKKSYQTKKSIIDAAMKSDLTIKVQDHMFLAHKDVLSSRNSVFETTITALSSKYISIPDSDPETFKIFLRHIYNHKVEKKDITAELFEVAYKYMDSKLQRICEEHFVSTISEKNAVQLLLLSTNVENRELENVTLSFITPRFEKLNLKEEFLKNKKNPGSVEAIFKVFEAVMKNSKAEQYVKSVLLKDVTDDLNVQKSTETFLGTLSFKIPETLPSKTRSRLFYLKQIPWYIRASMTVENQGYLGIYLCCDDTALPYSHKITYSLKMISSVDKTFELSMNATSVFTATDASQTTNSWGLKNFIPLSTLHDATKGYLDKEGQQISVRVEAKILE